MVFSEDFKTIESGCNKQLGRTGEDLGETKFGAREVLRYKIFDEARATMEDALRRRARR